VGDERKAQPVPAEPLGHVAAIDEPQLEEGAASAPSHRERTRVEAAHDTAADVEDDDDAEPEPHAHAARAQRPRRQEDERGMVAGLGSARKRGSDMQDGLRAGSDSEPSRPQPQPRDCAARWAHARAPAQRASESGPRHVDEQRPPARVPHRDRRDRPAPERQAQRGRAEPDAPAGRGTRDGCRGRGEKRRRKRASHFPITVNVNVAV
jgi:hypothetical protein